MDYITINQWISLKKETRKKLKEVFFIPSTGMTEVVTDEYGVSHIKSDGHTNVDLQVVTVEKLVDYLGTAAINESIYDLWKRAVEKVETPPLPVEPIAIEPEVLSKAIEMLTSTDPLKCERCPFVSGSARGLKIHKGKHNRVKGV